jgi:putative chitinase
VNRDTFYARLRETLFKGGLKQSHVDTINAILDEAEHRNTLLTRLAYILATSRHEPGESMVPGEENLYYTTAKRIREVWPSRFPTLETATPFVKNPRGLANKVYNGRLGNREGSDDGWTYRGRGLAQITGRDNYQRAGAKIGLDLVASPERAKELSIAVDILFSGMEEGWFTGITLDDVDGTKSYVDDRKVINGADQASLIASYATAFESALKAAGYATVSPPANTVNLTAEELAEARRWLMWRAAAPAGAIEWLRAMPKEIA